MLNETGKKIAILAPNFTEFDGGSQTAKLQAEELAKKGNSVAVFTLGGEMKAEGASIFVMGMPRSLFWQRIYRLFFPLDIVTVWKWLPKLKGYDQTIVHYYPMTWLAYLAKKLYKVKYTFWYHGIMDPQFLPRFYERVYMRLHTLFTRLTVSNVDHAVAVSKYGQRELKKNTGLDSEVIYNETDLSLFQPGLDGSEIRKKYNLNNDPVVLFAGAIRPVKGLHFLISAFKLVKNELSDAKLIIVGSCDYPYYLEELKSISDDSVIFTGFIPNKTLPYYYSMCDIYATCSLWEIHSRTFVEAQACGKPTIAFNIPAFEEWESNPAITLVPPRQVERFAQVCIQKLKEVRGQEHSS